MGIPDQVAWMGRRKLGASKLRKKKKIIDLKKDMWRRKNKFPFRNDKKDFSQIGARKKKY